MTEINAIEFTNILLKNYRSSKRLPTYTDEQQNIFEKQVRIEDRLLTQTRLCSTNDSKNSGGITIADISDYNSEKFAEECRYRFWDVNFMETARCMINTIIDMKDGNDESERFRIQKFLSDVMRMGTPSAFNFALGGNITNKFHHYKGKTVVIKCPKESYSAKELIHELIIGTCALNNLRAHVPNFSYVYDAFYCSAPVVQDNSGEIINWCMKSDNAVSYVIYEAIEHKYNISNFIKLCKYQIAGVELLSYIMQLALALYLANNEYDFTHCDLHVENVLLREYVDEFFYIPYSFEGKQYFVPSLGKIATIIDYGMSHIKLKDGTHLSKLDSSGYFENIGIGKETSVITDLYKLLGFSCRESIINNNNAVFSPLSRFFTYYFYGNANMPFETLLEIIRLQDECYYNIPAYIVNDMGWNINDFIKKLCNFAFKEYNMVLLAEQIPEGSKLFASFTKPFKEVEKIKEELNLEIPDVPTLFDLYQSPNNEKIINNVKNNITSILRDEKLSIDKLLNIHLQSFYAIHKNEESLKRSLGYALMSINKLASIVTTADRLHEKIVEYNKAIKILCELPELKIFTDLCHKKYTEICSYLRGLYGQIVINRDHISTFLDKYDLDNVSDDTYRYIEDLKNLQDKHNKVIDSINSMNIVI